MEQNAVFCYRSKEDTLAKNIPGSITGTTTGTDTIIQMDCKCLAHKQNWFSTGLCCSSA